jgi:hypothetical protein
MQPAASANLTVRLVYPERPISKTRANRAEKRRIHLKYRYRTGNNNILTKVWEGKKHVSTKQLYCTGITII